MAGLFLFSNPKGPSTPAFWEFDVTLGIFPLLEEIVFLDLRQDTVETATLPENQEGGFYVHKIEINFKN